jgi:DNA-binding MarR family transcriptional regulator
MSAPGPVNFDALAQAIQNSGCLALREVARELTRLLDEMLTPAGVRAIELGILRVCAISGPISMQELADGLEASRSMAQRGVRPLISRQMLVSRRYPGRRAALLELTPAGKQALLAGITCWDRLQLQLMQHLGSQRWERIQQQFDTFTGLAS